MSRNRQKPTYAPESVAHPRYEFRILFGRNKRYQFEVWQLPSPATPRLSAPEQIATLKGRPLELIEHRILKRLAREKIQVGNLAPGNQAGYPIDEDVALHLGLLFRTLAPMSNIDRIKTVSEAIDDMSREEASYWLGMVMHRHYPRRVLASLRLLTSA